MSPFVWQLCHLSSTSFKKIEFPIFKYSYISNQNKVSNTGKYLPPLPPVPHFHENFREHSKILSSLITLYYRTLYNWSDTFYFMYIRKNFMYKDIRPTQVSLFFILLMWRFIHHDIKTNLDKDVKLQEVNYKVFWYCDNSR